MSDQYLAEIRIFPFNFAPAGWAFCAGQIMLISQNTALFSLLGTTYGGDGVRTFALPNLQGQVPLQQGQGPNLSLYVLGEQTGETAVSLLPNHNPTHNHPLTADQDKAIAGSPSYNRFQRGHYSAGTSEGGVAAYSTQQPNTTLSPQAVAPAGSGAPHNNMMPYLTLNFCIALRGYFPTRS